MYNVLWHVVDGVLEEKPVTVAKEGTLGAALESDCVHTIPEREVLRTLW